MDSRYDVITQGKIIPGWKMEDVQSNLATLFKTDPSKVQKLLAGKAVVVRKGVDKALGTQLVEKLEAAGADTKLVKKGDTPSAAQAGGGKAETAAARACPKCEFSPVRGGECPQCGVLIDKIAAGTPNPAPALGSPSSPEEDWAHFVVRNKEKYLRWFRQFRQNDDRFVLTWNWATFFLGIWWLLYRKLYLWALVSLVVSFIPYLNLLFHLALSGAANYLYYQHARKRIQTVRDDTSGSRLGAALSQAGGVSMVAAAVCGGVVGLAALGIVAAIAIPNFVAYRDRAALEYFDTSAALRPRFLTTEGSRRAGTAVVVRTPEFDGCLLITAHHLFSPAGGFERYYAWEEIAPLVQKVTATSILDGITVLETAEVLPIPGGHPVDENGAGNDLAVFPLSGEPDIPVLTLAAKLPRRHEKIWLLAEIMNLPDAEQLLHPARIIESEDSGLVYVFDDPELDLTATSGAPLLNRKGQVVGLNVAFVTEDGRLVGFGNPSPGIRERISQALNESS